MAFTDPARTGDLSALAIALQRGEALVYRPFGEPDALPKATRLAAIARTRGLLLLIGGDARLAAAVRADGVHLPERMARRARAIRRPGWIVTAAAHSPRAACEALRAGADAVVASTAFPSRSPSAGKPLGPLRLALLAKAAGGPVYALGGVSDATAARLRPAGLVGLAAVQALSPGAAVDLESGPGPGLR